MSKDIRIVVAQRGWNLVGEYTLAGDEVVLANASVIRRWGTTRGLGQIAADGPTPETRLDPCGTVRIHKLAVVLTMDCDAGSWAGK
jgi:hypothetical protein